MNKIQFNEIFTPHNRYNSTEIYNETFLLIEKLIKIDKGHCEEYYVDSVYYDQSRAKFEIEVLITSKEDLEKGDINESNPTTFYYSIEDILELINK